jgi:predicted TIM-barrel fold metal-dependent hydrolase
MKIIDVNTMLGPTPAPARYRDAEGLLRYLDDYRITSTVTCHSAAQMVPWQYNAEMSQIAGASGGRISACLVLDPMLAEKSLPGEGTLLERLNASRPSAVRMFPKTQRYPLSAFFCDHILGTLDELRLPLLLDADEMPRLEDIPPLAHDFPHMPIVILRHYFNASRALTPLLTKLENVYIDINIIIDTGYLEELVRERCGSDKLLLGSGLPHHVPAGGLSMVFYSDLDDSHKHNILHANWERLQGGIQYDHP